MCAKLDAPFHSCFKCSELELGNQVYVILKSSVYVKDTAQIHPLVLLACLHVRAQCKQPKHTCFAETEVIGKAWEWAVPKGRNSLDQYFLRHPVHPPWSLGWQPFISSLSQPFFTSQQLYVPEENLFMQIIFLALPLQKDLYRLDC